jgi:hypothetical protein
MLCFISARILHGILTRFQRSEPLDTESTRTVISSDFSEIHQKTGETCRGDIQHIQLIVITAVILTKGIERCCHSGS